MLKTGQIDSQQIPAIPNILLQQEAEEDLNDKTPKVGRDPDGRKYGVALDYR